MSAQTSSTTIKGRLLLEPRREDQPRGGFHNVKVRVGYRKTPLSKAVYWFGETDESGGYLIQAPLSIASSSRYPQFTMQVFTEDFYYTNDGQRQVKVICIYSTRKTKSVSDSQIDFGTHPVPYWRYDQSSPIPRVDLSRPQRRLQRYSSARQISSWVVMSRVALVAVKHVILGKLLPKMLSADQIQGDFPPNHTRKLEMDQPGFTRSDEYFAQRFLNGMTVSVLDQNPDCPEEFWYYNHWNSYQQDGEYARPNVDIKFKLVDQNLVPSRISLSLLETDPDNGTNHVRKISFSPEDGEAWLQVKRHARVSANLAAEVDVHLTQTHLNIEQYALAFYRNVRLNPVRHLLFPHLKQTHLVTVEADQMLVGPRGYLAYATGLTSDGLYARVAQVMGTLDWKNWYPMQPICEEHEYAKAGNLFWQVLCVWVERFFDRNHDEIVEHWREILRASQELVENSVPQYLCRYLQHNLSAEPELPAWFTKDERMDLTTRELAINPDLKAISPITETRLPEDHDLENLKQVCRYVIYHATFKHSWSNKRQYDEGGELRFSGVGLRYSQSGELAHEDDDSVIPPPILASFQLLISYILAHTDGGSITQNPDRDIHPEFIELLEAHRGQFADLGFNIDEIGVCANV